MKKTIIAIGGGEMGRIKNHEDGTREQKPWDTEKADRKIVETDGSTEICLYYSRNEYTIRFTYGDIVGAGEDVVYKLPYESAITAPDFKVAGYVLVGWTPDVPETVPAENITYTIIRLIELQK